VRATVSVPRLRVIEDRSRPRAHRELAQVHEWQRDKGRPGRRDQPLALEGPDQEARDSEV